MLDHEARVLGALGKGVHQHVAHLRQQHRLAARNHTRHRMFAVRVQRMTPTQGLQIVGEPHIARRHRDLSDRAACVVAQVDRAQVRQARHRQLRHLLHGRRQIQGTGHHRARLDEQFHGDVARGRLLCHGLSVPGWPTPTAAGSLPPRAYRRKLDQDASVWQRDCHRARAGARTQSWLRAHALLREPRCPRARSGSAFRHRVG